MFEHTLDPAQLEDKDLRDVMAAPDAMPKVVPAVLPGPPDWSAYFGNDNPLEFEIGFGRPHYIFERAAAAPAHNIVGVEWKGKWARAANKKKGRLGIANLCAIHGNAWLMAGTLFRPGSLSAVHVNFPDPWWKARHRKRRILNPAFVALLASRLKPGGCVFVQTDVASMLEEYLECLEESPLLENPYGPGRLTPENPMGATSHREKKCVAQGIPVFRAQVVKVGA